MIELYDFQQRLKADIYREWGAGNRVVMPVLPTGGGKTVVVSSVIYDHNGASCAIAHRQELVGQISVALARMGVRHRLICPEPVGRAIVGAHLDDVGANFVDPNAACAVAGVDTLIRMDPRTPWLRQVTLWVQDEGHHVLAANKWGRAAQLFSNPACRGLLPTATPRRADGKGLGRQYDGLADAMVLGPTQRELIERGFLTDYRLACPKSDIQLGADDVGASGDYTAAKLKAAARRSHIVGDVVREYCNRAFGKLGVTFATDVDTATDIAIRYREAGVPAEVISCKTPDAARRAILARFRNRELWQLVNVDMFGEGFDLPAIEVVSLARPTESLALFMQQFGRALRRMEGKQYALIIDHVGAVERHGLPDKLDRIADWTLLPTKATRSSTGEVPLKTCANPEGGEGSTLDESKGWRVGGIACARPYPRTNRVCPYCGFYPEPPARSGPEFVDGDIFELDADTLARMRGEIAAADRSIDDERARLAATGLPHIPLMANVKRHAERQDAQRQLREVMAWWGGVQTARGLDDSQAARLFWFRFNVDTLSAQALKANEANELRDRIRARLVQDGEPLPPGDEWS